MTLAPSSDAPRLRPGPFARLALAWLLTMGILVYAWARTLVGGRLMGAPEPIFVVLLLLGIVAVVLLTRGLAARLPWKSARGVVLAVLVPWVLVAGALIAAYTGPRFPLLPVVALFVPATLWVPWAAWMFFRPWSPAVQLGVLALLLAAVGGFWLLDVRGMSGDARLDFAWRWERPGGNFEEGEPPTPGEIDLTRTTPHDYPQFLGPSRTGVLPEGGPAYDWEQWPPRLLWRRPVGAGWGGFAVVGAYAVTQEQQGDEECVVCYRVADGRRVWRHADRARYDSSLGGPGPRATPTVHDGRVYAVGATGLLHCLDGATGKRLWGRNILEDHGAEILPHGVCGSPLLVGDCVLVCPTGRDGISLAAYHRDTGEPLWRGESDRASYGSPLLTELHGVPQVLLYNSAGIAAHDLATGQRLWQLPWANREATHCSQPIVHAGGPGKVHVATGYGKGSALFEVERSAGNAWSVWPLWQSRHLKAKFATPVLYDDCVYGLDDGILACQDVTTGDLRWKEGRYGHGQLLLVGDRLLIQAEDGSIVLVRPNPDRLDERASFPALSGKTWNNPALAGRYLLVRNDQEAACYELPLKKE